MKIIVSRTDRAGDLILTTPLFRELRRSFPHATLIAHVRSYTAAIINLCREVDEIIIDDDFNSTLALAKKFAGVKAERIIIAHPARKTILAAFLARIPIRTGRASNIWQLFLNDRRVQKRSRNEKHEFAYNIDLLERIVENPEYLPPALKFSETSRSIAEKIILNFGLKHPVFIHPGHGGSAHNLSAQQYARIAAMLISRGFQVAVTIGPGEESMALHFRDFAPDRLAVIARIPDFSVLAALFSYGKAFVGGSTGPMHLAAAVGLPVLAFFPPVAAMTPIRWGPTSAQSHVIMPTGESCKNLCDSCSRKGCMQTIDLEAGIKWLERICTNESSSSDK